jgi:hypothetical protein
MRLRHITTSAIMAAAIFIMHMPAANAAAGNNFESNLYETAVNDLDTDSYDKEYINEILHGNNSLSESERRTLTDAYNKINNLQRQIDGIDSDIEELENRLYKDFEAQDQDEIEKEIKNSTKISENEKQELIAGYKKVDELTEQINKVYDVDRELTSEEESKVKELENKLDEIYKKNAEIEDKVFEDNRITPVPYDDDSDTSK